MKRKKGSLKIIKNLSLFSLIVFFAPICPSATLYLKPRCCSFPCLCPPSQKQKEKGVKKSNWQKVLSFLLLFLLLWGFFVLLLRPLL